jgi:hypothetical protein
MHVRMRPLLVTAAAVAVLAIALPSQAALDTQATTLTIRLVSVTTQVRLQRDVAPKNVASKGDVLWQKSVLRNAVAQFGKPKGALVGSDTGTMTLVSARVVDTKGTAVLPGGTIRFAGRITEAASEENISVTGGTGRYAGAKGRLEVRSLDASGTKTTNVYRLTLP